MPSVDNKECKRCGNILPLTSFYKHKEMLDGYLNFCIDCTKRRVLKYRVKNIDKIRAYDRARGSRQSADCVRRYREKNPKKYKAFTMVGNAVRDGLLMRPRACSACSVEGRVYGHHDDYNRPLSVRWLCQVCHKAWHSDNGEGLNG